jgi:hypothetical protein
MDGFGQVGTRNHRTPQAIDTTVESIPRGVVLAAPSIGRDGELVRRSFPYRTRNLPGAGIERAHPDDRNAPSASQADAERDSHAKT